jgi:hypothetical protein
LGVWVDFFRDRIRKVCQVDAPDPGHSIGRVSLVRYMDFHKEYDIELRD